MFFSTVSFFVYACGFQCLACACSPRRNLSNGKTRKMNDAMRSVLDDATQLLL